MKNIVIFFTTVFLVILLGVYLNSRDVQEEGEVRGVMEVDDGLLRIALCPTWYFLEEPLREEFGSLLVLYKTFSTSESLGLMEKDHVDYVLAGRTLYEDEGEYENVVLGDGLAFVSKEAKFIQESEINDYSYVTNLDLSYVKDFVVLKNIEKGDIRKLKKILFIFSDGMISI
jgi:hypothetical protein